MYHHEEIPFLPLLFSSACSLFYYLRAAWSMFRQRKGGQQ